MDMYAQISRYYDEIFPVDIKTLDFIKQAAGDPPQYVMDVACGSGGYAIEMSKAGHKVIATDSNPDMVLYASKKAHENDALIDIVECDMRNITTKIESKFNFIYCIGNSIVHITDIDQIADVFRGMNKLLVEGGKVVIQILNYQKVIDLKINELPVIKNEDSGVTFIRKYDLENPDGLVRFNTELIIDNHLANASIKGIVDLYPLRKDQLVEILDKCGFKNIEVYGDFSWTAFDGDSAMLVVKAEKLAK